jgi:hypothetical protein
MKGIYEKPTANIFNSENLKASSVSKSTWVMCTLTISSQYYTGAGKKGEKKDSLFNGYLISVSQEERF